METLPNPGIEILERLTTWRESPSITISDTALQLVSGVAAASGEEKPHPKLETDDVVKPE